MSEVGQKLKTVLEGYAKFLRDRDLAPPKHQPHLVRWVREFLLSAEEYSGYAFEQALDLFLAGCRRTSRHQAVADPAGSVGDSLGNPRRKRSTDG